MIATKENKRERYYGKNLCPSIVRILTSYRVRINKALYNYENHTKPIHNCESTTKAFDNRALQDRIPQDRFPQTRKPQDTTITTNQDHLQTNIFKY